MVYVPFTSVDEPEPFEPLGEGIYRVVVERIEIRSTREHDEMWRVQLRVVAGPGDCHDRCVFDSWVFSARALPRFKLIASRFGVDVSLDRTILPQEFLGREVDVEVRERRVALAGGGERVERYVPYAGYLDLRGPGEPDQLVR